jgi:hypothetical protein
MTTLLDQLVRCTACAQTTPSGIRISGRRYACARCADDMFACDGCGQLSDTFTTTDDSHDLCFSCEQADGYYPCRDCGTSIRQGSHCSNHIAAEDDESFTCDQCLNTVPLRLHEPLEATGGRQLCTTCTEYFDLCWYCDLHDDELRSTDSGRDMCNECARNLDYIECRTCTTLIDSGTYCSFHDRDDDLDSLHPCGYKPKPIFHGIGPRYLGLELEINVRYGDLPARITEAVTALDDLGYLKEDCSIDCGFELVTHPMAYRWALQSFPWHLLDQLDNHGCSGEGTGLHVHISRDAFTGPCHVFRWMKFIYRNASDVQALARRHSLEYARFHGHERDNVKHSCKGQYYGNRYSAINTQPENTLELRIFASSLDVQQVQAALAFADASVAYTRDLTVPDITRRSGWTWPTFTQWLLTRPQYAPLTRELEDLACAC